jgi:hypothetical protein
MGQPARSFPLPGKKNGFDMAKTGRLWVEWFQVRQLNQSKEPHLSRTTKFPSGVFLLVMLLLAVGQGSSLADDLALSSIGAADSADSVFAAMSAAWQAGDELLMAGLVHENGLRVTLGGEDERFITYSPDQSFYYFQDLFHGRRTLQFQFRRLPDPAESKRIMGIVEWKIRLSGQEKTGEMKWMAVFTRQGPRWRISELNSISQR